MKLKNLIVLIFSVALTGCVTTKTTGFVDPEYSGGAYHLRKVVVRADGASLEGMGLAETALVNKFKEVGVDAIRYMDIVPPTRNYDFKKAMKIVDNTGADALFITSIDDVSVSETYVPPTYHAGTSTSTVNMIGNTAYVNTYSSPGYTTGGYTVSKPLMSSSSFLIDMKNGNNIWKAEGFSNGNAFSDYSDLLISAGKSAIEDLKVKNLIQTESLTSNNKIIKPKEE